MVANAFPTDIWIKVDAEKVMVSYPCFIEVHTCFHSQERSFNKAGEASAGAQIPVANVGANLTAGFDYSQTESVSVHKVFEAGFTKVPFQGVATFKPECHESKDTVYISIAHFNAEQEGSHIALNLPHHKSHAVIVTATGGVVDSKKGSPWIDLNNKDHQPSDPCEDCLSLESVCSVCSVEGKLEEVQRSVEIHYRLIKNISACKYCKMIQIH